MTKASDRTSDFLGDLGDAVKRNPLPAALVGMGIMWLFSNRSQIADAGSGVVRSLGQGAGSPAKSASNDVKDGLSTASQTAKDRVTSSIDAVTEGANRMSDSVSSSLRPRSCDGRRCVRRSSRQSVGNLPPAAACAGGTRSGRRCRRGCLNACHRRGKPIYGRHQRSDEGESGRNL